MALRDIEAAPELRVVRGRGRPRGSVKPFPKLGLDESSWKRLNRHLSEILTLSEGPADWWAEEPDAEGEYRYFQQSPRPRSEKSGKRGTGPKAGGLSTPDNDGRPDPLAKEDRLGDAITRQWLRDYAATYPTDYGRMQDRFVARAVKGECIGEDGYGPLQQSAYSTKAESTLRKDARLWKSREPTRFVGANVLSDGDDPVFLEDLAHVKWLFPGIHGAQKLQHVNRGWAYVDPKNLRHPDYEAGLGLSAEVKRLARTDAELRAMLAVLARDEREYLEALRLRADWLPIFLAILNRRYGFEEPRRVELWTEWRRWRTEEDQLTRDLEKRLFDRSKWSYESFRTERSEGGLAPFQIVRLDEARINHRIVLISEETGMRFWFRKEITVYPRRRTAVAQIPEVRVWRYRP
jgi:hypothetical protein